MTTAQQPLARRVLPAVAVPAWAWALTLLALFTLYLVTQDNGAVLAQAGDVAHEFFHDARHALGMPCH
ncbi:CbtB-domain containing protein [Nakamurella flava]|uniref:CbtB-domain containing protein n=1 Tax=Nakamurella flava TaxID=2576308 RepID=A0A4U6QB79_9ACTN|nr:CbtB-domain containing protein [Nakamurella flava]TKV57297.1 CbtB-domain containing protein [Nakamurella flava]